MTQQIKSELCEWCDEAEQMLLAAANHCSIDDIKNQVFLDDAQLFRVSTGEVLIGYYVLRIDQLFDHSEAVIVAAAGRNELIDLTMTVCPAIENQVVNCKFIRIHTSRPGLIKKLSAIGYAPQEFVMRKAL